MARLIADEVANHLILIGPANLSDSEDNFAQSFIHQQLEDTQASILSGQKRIKDIEAIMDNTLSTTRKSELQIEKTTLERLVADYVMNYVELSNLTTQEKKPNSLSVIETAHSENDPIRPRVPLYILLSTGVGFLLALGIIFLWEYLDDAIKSIDDLAQFKELNILGSVGRIRGQKESERIVTYLKSSSPTTESYRMICNKIRVGSDENLIKSIVITSPGTDEGNSITAVNLGITMAQAKIKTILVDANFQHPFLHQIFNVRINAGLAELITSPETDIDYCLKQTSIDNLRIITNGVSSQNQSERLHIERLSEILESLEEKADLIIIDSPPALLTVDAMILSNRVDGVILEIRAGKSTLSAIRQTLKELQEANAHLLGYIYNQYPKENPYAIYTRHEQGKSLIYHLKTLVNKAH
jgi:capsular exopolysaccharide synthesis family protein